MAAIVRFCKDQTGATVIEYALIASLLSVAVVTALTALGGKLSGTYTKIEAKLPSL